MFVICFLAFCVLSLGLCSFLGEDFFPQVDAGLLRLHVRARAGLRVEETARLCDEIEAIFARADSQGQLQTILDNIGLPNSGINQSYSSSRNDRHQRCGDSDRARSGTSSADRRPDAATCAQSLPRRFPGVEFFFQPADIVTQILNFGLPAPIDVQVVGTDMQSNYSIAQQIANRMRHVPGRRRRPRAADVLAAHSAHGHRAHPSDAGRPDRPRRRPERLVSLSGSFQTSPNFWLNPKNEVTYQIAVQSPQYRMTRLQDLMNMPVDLAAGDSQLMGNLVQLSPGRAPCDREPLQRAAGDRCLCQHAGSRSGCRGRRHR